MKNKSQNKRKKTIRRNTYYSERPERVSRFTIKQKAKNKEQRTETNKSALFYKNFRPIIKQDILDYNKVCNTYYKDNGLEITANNIKKITIEEYKRIIDYLYYRDLEPKLNFEILTVENLRRNFWNAKNSKWMTINLYSSGDGENPNLPFGPFNYGYNGHPKNKINFNKVYNITFIPDGNMQEFISVNGKRLSKIYKDWLQSNNRPPYKKEDYNKQFKKYYTLTGKIEYNQDGQIYYNDVLQICSGPILNCVTLNCMSGVSWILKNNFD